MFTNHRSSDSSGRRFSLVLALLCAVLTIVGIRQTTQAQVPPVLQLPEAPAPASKEKPKRTLEVWRAEVKQRLEEAESQSQEASQDENEPSPTLKRQLEILARVDLTLVQLADEQGQAKKIKDDQQKLQKELDQLVQHGLRNKEETSFRQLDQLRDDLQSEQRRLKRIVGKEKVAVSALEKALPDLQEKNSARRLAKENSAENTDDKLRQNLGEKLSAAVWLSELADAVAQLRKQEVVNAKAATKLQELKVLLLKEKEARLQSVVKFGAKELEELLVELDRQEDDLKSDLDSVEGAATRLKYLDEQWMRAQRQLDQSTGDKTVLRAEINAYQLGRRALQQQLPLLRMQLDRLSSDRTVWKRRKQAFSRSSARQEIREWTEESSDALGQLQREERTEVFEIEEIRDQLKPLKAALEKAEQETPEAYWLGQQVESLRKLQESHQNSLNSIQTSKQLQEKLLNQLSSDSLAATAKDHVSDLWHGVESFWHYELTSFNEQSVTVQKVVTALLILFAGIIFSKALSRALGRQVLRRLDIDPSASATIQSLFYYVLLLLFGLFALNVAKVPLTAFTVLGGAVALGVGFGSQNIINNFISGLILHAERPVKVGDLIQLDNLNGKPLYGNIEHIGARSTRVRTGSNLEIIIPNSSFLQNNVVNFTLSSDKVRTMVEVGVVYGSPTVTVTQLLRRAVIETGRVAKEPPPIILFKSFGDNSLQFEVHFWIRMRTMMDQMQIESAVRFRIDQLFREEGIVIAFPQSDVHLDTSSPLTIQMVEPATGENPS